MASILLEIVTPEGSKLREQVDELTAPSISGEFGVLPGHLPILAAVKTGILTWRKGGETGACAIGWGFIEVSSDHAYVLTDRFVRKEEVDPVRVRAELKTLDDKIDHFPGSPESPEFHQLVGEEVWAAVQLELYGDPPPPTVAFVTPYGAAPDQGEDGPDVNAPAPGLLEENEKLASPLRAKRPRRSSSRSAVGGAAVLSSTQALQAKLAARGRAGLAAPADTSDDSPAQPAVKGPHQRAQPAAGGRRRWRSAKHPSPRGSLPSTSWRLGLGQACLSNSGSWRGAC